MFSNIYRGKRVLVTGHTGFKGSWLVEWLDMLGADVFGYSLEESVTQPSHFKLLKSNLTSEIGDVCDFEHLSRFLEFAKPDIVFHLAAQPLVRYSYANPLETFTTNVLGTANILEVCRRSSSVKAFINVTTDKCYENKEWLWSYRENEPLGGYDPYSASKACSELVTSSYRSSYPECRLLIASARAGNVIGGGDWAGDRLVPDIVRAAFDTNQSIEIRSPRAIRPWQHVLEPLSGYLLLGQKLLEGKKEFAEAWNFGPEESGHICVKDVLEGLKKFIPVEVEYGKSLLHEANLLKLDCSKARVNLGWKPVLNVDEMLSYTAQWYLAFYTEELLSTKQQIETYANLAKVKNREWAL